MTKSFLSNYLKEEKELQNNTEIIFLIHLRCVLHKQIWLVIRYFLLPHTPDFGGGEDGAGGGLQQEGGRDAGDRDGGTQGGRSSRSPLGRVRSLAWNSRSSWGFRPLAHRECLPTSGPMVSMHAAVRYFPDG